MIFAFDERTIGSGSAVGRHHGRLIRESTIRSFGPRTNKVHNLAHRRLPLKSYVTTGARCRPGLFCCPISSPAPDGKVARARAANEAREMAYSAGPAPQPGYQSGPYPTFDDGDAEMVRSRVSPRATPSPARRNTYPLACASNPARPRVPCPFPPRATDPIVSPIVSQGGPVKRPRARAPTVGRPARCSRGPRPQRRARGGRPASSRPSRTRRSDSLTSVASRPSPRATPRRPSPTSARPIDGRASAARPVAVARRAERRLVARRRRRRRRSVGRSPRQDARRAGEDQEQGVLPRHPPRHRRRRRRSRVRPRAQGERSTTSSERTGSKMTTTNSGPPSWRRASFSSTTCSRPPGSTRRSKPPRANPRKRTTPRVRLRGRFGRGTGT